jgi:hypothetical protein
MRFFQRGEEVDSKFTFLDNTTGEQIDIINGSYRIVHYVGPVEVIDVNQTPLYKVPSRVGEYLVNWDIPSNAPENETYFVIATGTNPVDNSYTLIEDFFRVLPNNFFSGGNGSGGMSIKFTKA